MTDQSNRREALQCMAWAGTGALWALSGGVASSSIIDRAIAATAPPSPFTFLQVSDSHIGFDKAANPDTRATLREGDWVRVTLVVDTGATRHFVALTDSVPGGLRPADLSLSGVGGLDLHKVDDAGSAYFDTRRLDARSPRFYAEYLPAGRHEVHYFARVGNSGDYLAAPAVAELMYGAATRARTAAARIAIVPAVPAAVPPSEKAAD